MCWERGQGGFCPLPFLATSLHTALSAWATPRALMFLSRRNARSGSCPPSKLQGHLNSFPALDNQSAATNVERIVPRALQNLLSKSYLGQYCSQLVQLRPCTSTTSRQKKPGATWWQGASLHLSWRWDSGNTRSPRHLLWCQPFCTALLPSCEVHNPLPLTQMQKTKPQRSQATARRASCHWN